MRIYFAGPLFTPYERGFIDQCASQLRSEGFEVFVPHEIPLPDPVTAEFIFAVDSKEVMGANAVLALLDVFEHRCEPWLFPLGGPHDEGLTAHAEVE